MPNNRKPLPLKLVQGTNRADRDNPDQPQPEVSIPAPPHHLSKEARAEWDRMAPILADMGLISEVDRSAFAMYCQSWGDHAKAENMIRKHGAVVKTTNGNIVQSPWVGISNRAKLIAHKFLVGFGMTPADRGKVTARKEETQEDPSKRFFK
jgi:P27 family predicted phage terminase small subunit